MDDNIRHNFEKLVTILTMRDSTIADNSSNLNCGGIYNAGRLTILGSTISGNSAGRHGGGITNEGGTLTITNSAIARNTAGTSGGGIANLEGSTLTITNDTIARNTAQHWGGGIENRNGNTHISFCTIYDNSASVGGGIAVEAGSVTMRNSILAGSNLVTGEKLSRPIIAGTLTSGGLNLIQNMANIAPQHLSAPDTSNLAVSRFTSVHDRTVSASDLTKIIDPKELQNNGGPTETYLLLPSSDNPAIDAIPQDACVDDQGHRVITDQRNMPRPDKNEKDGQRCDIGAYESSD